MLRTAWCLGLVLLLLQAPAWSWNRTGHWITAAVAYEALRRDDPAALQAAVDLLRAHPSAEDWLAWREEFPNLEPGMILFMMASVFADDSRRGKYEAFDRPDWHYINYAIRPGQTTRDIRTSTALTGRLPDALRENLALMRDPALPADQRALALSWVLHLIGDLHQPLHTTGLVNADFPTGDRGGNDVFVRDPAQPQFALRLHQLWDDALGGATRDMPAVRTRALGLAQGLTATATAPDGDAAQWLAESFSASVELGYRDGDLRYALLIDVLPPAPTPAEPSVSGGAAGVAAPRPMPQPLRGDKAPPLPAGYLEDMQRYAQARLVQCGLRIARALSGLQPR